jgi:uncharacterized membrane protein YqiK
MKFQPIHNFVPRKIKPSDSDVPFITLNSRNGNSQESWIGESGNFISDSSAEEFVKNQKEEAEKEKIKQDKLIAKAEEEKSKATAAQAQITADNLKKQLAIEEKRKQTAIVEKKAAEEAHIKALADKVADDYALAQKTALELINPVNSFSTGQ